MGEILKSRKTIREKLIFWLSVGMFAALNLVPGLMHSYADAQYGGGGGGSCPGSRCTGAKQPVCCDIQVCDAQGKCTTNSYYFP